MKHTFCNINVLQKEIKLAVQEQT